MSSLRQLVRTATIHEQQPTPVDPHLRRAAWWGLGLLGAYVLYMYLGWLWFPPRVGGTDLLVVGPALTFALDPFGAGPLLFKTAVAATAAAGAVAVATDGFHVGTIAEHYTMFAIFVTGLVAAIPPLIAALALVAFVAGIIALIIGGAIAGVAVLALAADALVDA